MRILPLRWQIPRKWGRLEFLLLLALCTLVVQLALPSLQRWWLRPRPGQVGIDYLPFKDATSPATISPAYAVYLPRSFGRSGKLPLVIFLHGAGEIGQEYERLLSTPPMTVLADGRLSVEAVIVEPQCLERSWSATDVLKFVEAICLKYALQPGQKLVIGYSMGASGACDILWRNPQTFSAAVLIAGPRASQTAAGLARVPLWVFHGQMDRTIAVTESKQLVQSVREAGGEPHLTTIEDAGHDICEEVFLRDDLWEWLLALDPAPNELGRYELSDETQ